ncbi:MAG TPA: hypothetical protein VF544_07880 [Pyrinomonadaceae bacterium]|jgi:hypothetical protein
MPIVKKRNQQTESRLLLESDEPLELPPAEVEDGAVIVQFEKFKPYVAELLEALRAGTVAETVPVMMDGSTFAVHGRTRTFWVKLWHAAGSERTRIERVQVISCLPSTRGLSIIVETGREQASDDGPDEDQERDEAQQEDQAD